MFEIFPAPMERIRRIISLDEKRDAEIAAILASNSIPTTSRRPFVQIVAGDISPDDVERILEFQEMTYHTPFGFPGKFKTRILKVEAGSILLFPLDELREHLSAVARESFREFSKAGTMDKLIEERKDDISAEEYLVCGILDCIRFCEKYNEVLTVRW